MTNRSKKQRLFVVTGNFYSTSGHTRRHMPLSLDNNLCSKYLFLKGFVFFLKSKYFVTKTNMKFCIYPFDNMDIFDLV